MARKGSMKQDQINVDTMLLLLATIYESARLVSAGSLLQRCSLKHGTISHFFFFVRSLIFFVRISLSVHLGFVCSVSCPNFQIYSDLDH